MTEISDLTAKGEPFEHPNIKFCPKDGDALMIDKIGFHYRGKTITDAGKAYTIFMEVLNGMKDEIDNRDWLPEKEEKVKDGF